MRSLRFVILPDAFSVPLLVIWTLRCWHLLVALLWVRSWLSVLKLLQLRLLRNQLRLRNELLLWSSELSSVLWTDWLTGVLLPDGVRPGNRLLRWHGVSRCCVLRCHEVSLSLWNLHDRSLGHGHDRIHWRGGRPRLRVSRLNSVVLRNVLKWRIPQWRVLVLRGCWLRLRVGLLNRSCLSITLRCGRGLRGLSVTRLGECARSSHFLITLSR